MRSVLTYLTPHEWWWIDVRGLLTDARRISIITSGVGCVVCGCSNLLRTQEIFRLSLWYWYYQVSALVSSALHDYASDILSITIIHREDLEDDATFLSLLACSIPSPELGKYSSFQRTSVNLEVYKPYVRVFATTIWVIMSLCSLQCLFPLSAQLKPSELLNILLEWIDTGTFT